MGRIAVTIGMTAWPAAGSGTMETFARGVDRSSSELRSHSGIDLAHLARAAKSAQFLRVSEPCMLAINGSRAGRHFPCLVRLPSGELDFSEQYSNHYRDWLTGSHPRSRSGQVSFGEIFDVANHLVEHVSRAYLETDHEQKEVHSICIIRRPDHIADE